jgi:hypothetical protein
VRILTGKIDAFVAEAKQVLTAGLASAGWVSVDDTGARHGDRWRMHTNRQCRFAAQFTTTKSKSRLNFLRLLYGGSARWVLNAASRAYIAARQST